MDFQYFRKRMTVFGRVYSLAKWPALGAQLPKGIASRIVMLSQ
jgi:hypothetical protein